MSLDIPQAIAAARQHFAAGRLDEASSLLDGVLAIDPGQGDALEGLAYIAAKRGKLTLAADYALRAAQATPPVAARYYSAARICQLAQRHEAAVQLFESCLKQAPNHLPSLHDMAQSLAQLGQHDRALQIFDQLAAEHSQLAEVHYNRGIVLGALGRYDEEIAAYRTAIAIRRDFTAAHVNLGVALRDLHRFDEALRQFGKAIAIDPDYPGARTNRGQTNLLLGRFEPGWREYEWRWRDGSEAHGFDPARQWRGDRSIAGRTLLVHCEQGLGDTLQFVRYVPLLAAAGARVILRVQEALLPLLRGLPGAVRVIDEKEPVPPFDLHCPMLSLPFALRTRADSIPAGVPYLRADPAKLGQWRDVLDAAQRRPRVGIAWAGSRVHVDDRNRSMALAEVAPLFAADAQFVSLQKDLREEDCATLQQIGSIIDVRHRLDSYADTAALIAQLDLVISVDTSIAHLAGALGTPVWIALPFTPDWRWQMRRTDSPWYPQARLFRQAVRGQWKGVVAELRAALDAWPRG